MLQADSKQKDGHTAARSTFIHYAQHLPIAFTHHGPPARFAKPSFEIMGTSNSVQPTRLSCKKGDFESEMWVQIDGKPVEVYGATVGADGTPEA